MRPSSLPHAHLSVNPSDNENDIECVRSPPPSPTHQSLPTSWPPLPASESPEIECLGVSQRTQCKQHTISFAPGQTAIGTYPFLLHIEEHTPWEFFSHCGSLLLHMRKCEDQNLDENGLCKPCQALLTNERFKKVLERVLDGVNGHTPYKYHGLASLAEITWQKEYTVEMFHL